MSIARRLLGEETALATSATWTVAPILALAGLLAWIAAPSRAPK